MIGHAVSNVFPVVAPTASCDECGQVFYGHSFICYERRRHPRRLGRDEAGVLAATLDLDAVKRHRAASASSATRPDLYGRLTQAI